MNDKVCIIDFDGTITHFSYPEMGDPQKGVKESLQKLKDMGYGIHIASCRTNRELAKHPIDRRDRIREMEDYLDKHEIPYDVVLDNDKALGYWYIDDRAIGFRGDWNKVIKEIENEQRRKNKKGKNS